MSAILKLQQLETLTRTLMLLVQHKVGLHQRVKAKQMAQFLFIFSLSLAQVFFVSFAALHMLFSQSNIIFQLK